MISDIPFFSICIPCYEMKGFGVEFLKFNLEAIKKQTFQNYEIVISDHSRDDEIKKLCNSLDLNIKYFKNENNIGKSSSNLNNAVSKAEGKWIKVIFQDDFLYGKHALMDLHEYIKANFQIYSDNYDENGICLQNNIDEAGWVVTNSEHTIDGIYLVNPYQAKWSLEVIKSGHNTISSPSVLTFKNQKDQNILFDENLLWLMDIDYYYRLYLKYGEPRIMNKINAVNRIWSGSVTSSVDQFTKDKEFEYFKQKLAKK
jgi:hypothetical protein